MSRFINDVVLRETGTLPLTIGTSVPFEKLREHVSQLGNYQSVWINIRTLIRNLHSALEPELKKRIRYTDIVPVLVEEIVFLGTYLNQLGLKGIFYYCDYSDIKKVLPHALGREASTDLQKQYVKIEQDAIAELLRQDVNGNILRFKTEIEATRDKAFILTHTAVDLLWYKRFSRLTLLESHTGNFKDKSEYHRKLTDGKKLDRIPFNKFTLQIFGDGNVYLKAMPIKIKRELLDIAEKYKWTPLTTTDKIRANITTLKDPFTREWLLKILKS